jgi:hypothetical protein
MVRVEFDQINFTADPLENFVSPPNPDSPHYGMELVGLSDYLKSDSHQSELCATTQGRCLLLPCVHAAVLLRLLRFSFRCAGESV